MADPSLNNMATQMEPQHHPPQSIPAQSLVETGGGGTDPSLSYSAIQFLVNPTTAIQSQATVAAPTFPMAPPNSVPPQGFLPNPVSQQVFANFLQSISASTAPEQRPTFVNAKQYDRILQRRKAKAALQVYYDKRRSTTRKRRNAKPYTYESRHKHAKKRPRGPKGRFIPKEDLPAYYAAHPEEDPGRDDTVNKNKGTQAPAIKELQDKQTPSLATATPTCTNETEPN